MKDFIKKGAKEAASFGSEAVKGAIGQILSDVTKEILDESGATDIAKDKISEVGLKVINDMGVNPAKIQRDLLKAAIKKELNL